MHIYTNLNVNVCMNSNYGQDPHSCTVYMHNKWERAVRCVSDSAKSGWHHRQEYPRCSDRWENLWWESDIWGECKRMNFEDAFDFCKSQGARLPTLKEAQDGCIAVKKIHQVEKSWL